MSPKLRPSEWIFIDLPRDKWEHITENYGPVHASSFDQVIEVVEELPIIQSKLLKGFWPISICQVSDGEPCIRVYLEKKTGTLSKLIAVDLYKEAESYYE